MMTDYISKEVACKELYESLKLELPDVGVAPIRHGRWIWLGPICDKFGEVEGRAFKCSACNYVLGIYHNSEFYRYCPFCGARMDEVEEDE